MNKNVFVYVNMFVCVYGQTKKENCSYNNLTYVTMSYMKIDNWYIVLI